MAATRASSFLSFGGEGPSESDPESPDGDFALRREEGGAPSTSGEWEGDLFLL